MGVAEGIAIVNFLIQSALQVYSGLKQTAGEEPIPTWDQILEDNAKLQAKIDAELTPPPPA